MTTLQRQQDLRSADGTRLGWFRADPTGAPKADVLLIHGYADHMGRYHHVAKALVDAGYRVFGLDLRGHGVAEGRRGHVRRWTEYSQDVDAAVAAIGSAPFIVAHSAGGLVALDYLRQNPARGVVLSATLLRPKLKAPFWKLAAARLLNRVIPALAMGNELKADEVSRHPDIVKGYETDPLVFHIITPRWFSEMGKAAERVLAHGSKYTLPAFAMYGTGEKIVDTGLIDRLASEWGGPIAKTVFPGLYHEIFNEPERADVLTATVQWLDTQVSK